MDKLRTPLFVLALFACALIVLIELGSPMITGGRGAGADFLVQAAKLDLEEMPSSSGVVEPPGRGIPYMALVDGILFYTLALMGVSLIVPERIHGRIQGIATIVGSILLIIGAIILAIIAFVELLVMVALFMSPPFGTLAYLAVWGFFSTGDASMLNGLLMFLKIVVCVLLLLAHQRFLQNKGLVLMLLTSLVCGVVLSFLHGLVPIILVSIIDNIAAIVFAVIAIIWGIILLIGSIPSVIKAIRSVA
ncbi:hypothetical protein [Mycolicibacterium phocaicum]|uniref:DUF4386 domain-containing protein n=1 Tax=Mycolicibacterium phocaicum TaxID=319706 RepID=A0AA94UCK4_9MYCO|nr:hypothetical protein [Mycolicibacterium phocaicum]TLH63945.1 hypothetical protein C1S79_20810 [Mycolicibacterium phocaicum]